MISKEWNPSKKIKKWVDEAKAVKEAFNGEDFRAPKGERGKKKITEFLKLCGFQTLNCPKVDCARYGKPMNFRWRDAIIDPASDILISGKIYNCCSSCESKKCY